MRLYYTQEHKLRKKCMESHYKPKPKDVDHHYLAISIYA